MPLNNLSALYVPQFSDPENGNDSVYLRVELGNKIVSVQYLRSAVFSTEVLMKW